MHLTALHPPKTLLEVYRMLPEGTRAELIDDQLFMSPAPSVKHQNLIFALAGQFYNYISKAKNGEGFVSPIDVYLDDKNVAQPDIVFVTKKNRTIVKKDGIYGAPDMIIEVLSPGTRKFDLDKKMKVYEKAGVKEYWVVDPDTKESSGYQFKNSKFVLLKKDKARITSAFLKHTFKF